MFKLALVDMSMSYLNFSIVTRSLRESMGIMLTPREKKLILFTET